MLGGIIMRFFFLLLLFQGSSSVVNTPLLFYPILRWTELSIKDKTIYINNATPGF